MQSLKQRLDPETGLVKPDWKGMAHELGVSRSTIARQMVGLHQCGAIETVYVPVDENFTFAHYRIINKQS